eukprot:evm.model.scf_2937.1 EVM.evm.TU.scf_2937.1   scf_2937:6754-8598(+)
MNAVRHFVSLAVKRGKVAELVQAVEDEHRLRMVTLGGGPGGALLGMLHWLADVGCWNCAVEEFVIDPLGTDWAGHQREIGKQVAKAGLGFEHTCLSCSYSSQITLQRAVDRVARADMVTIVKGVSSTSCGAGGARDNVWGLLRHMKNGAVLLVIDDTVAVEQFVGECADVASFQAVARMDFDDAKTASFVLPKDEERLASCFQSVATKFGGWPVQEAYITGIVFKKVVPSSGQDSALRNGMNTHCKTVPLMKRRVHHSGSQWQSQHSAAASRAQSQASTSGGLGFRKLSEQSNTKGADDAVAAGRRMHTSVTGGYQTAGHGGRHGSARSHTTATSFRHTFNKKNKSTAMQPANAVVKVESRGMPPGVYGANGTSAAGSGILGVSNVEVETEARQCSSLLLPVAPVGGKIQLRQQQQEWQWATTSNVNAQGPEGGQQRATKVVDLNTHRLVDPSASNPSSHQHTRVVDLNYQRVVDGQAQSRANSTSTTVVDLNKHRVVAVNQEGCQNSRVVDLRHQRVVSSDPMSQSANHSTAVVDLNKQRLVGLGGSVQACVGSAQGQPLGAVPAVQRPMMVVPTQASVYGALGSADGQLAGKRALPDNPQMHRLSLKQIRYF